ncbi:MAG: S9 family peptidase [Candidatus Eremiobacteraeota bacterium]|nr:S9 family peptidase [Candidatus Eremiobacteraeota bacterium]
MMVAAAVLLATALGAMAAPRAVTEDAYRSLVALHGPAISPDAKRAVVVVSRVVWDEDRYANDLVLVDPATHQTQTLLADRKGLADPAFSPDGARLAFLADAKIGDDSATELFVMPGEGGAAQQLTHVKSGVDRFAWRPDGKAIVYAAEDETPQRTGADRFRDSFIFTTEPIVARRADAPVHLFLLPLDGSPATQLTFGAESLCDGSTLSWSPSGTTLAYALCRDAIYNDQDYSRIVLLDVAGRRFHALTGRSMWESNPLFSPDGAHVAYTYSTGDGQVNLTELYVTTPSGGAGTRLSAALDRDVGDAVWSPDSRSLIITAPDRTTNALYRLSLDGSAQRLDVRDVTPGVPLTTTGGANAPALENALAKDGTLAFIGTAAAQPPELFTYGASGGTQKATGFNAALAQYAWGKAERITFRSDAGVAADGVLYYPPEFQTGKRYPLVVFVHGGPTDPSMIEFDFWAQVMAARGWLVLRPNYRGSPNLGLKYQRAILYDVEAGPGRDIMAALGSVEARGIVDRSRIAVSGWSYGGIMTAWMISRYHVWKAAVSGASVNDWIADYGSADDSDADAALFHGSPFLRGNAEEWRRASAIEYARDVTTPVLILSDIGDNRDPFATSSMYWRALRDNHKAATLRVWPVQGHFPGDPVRTVDVFHYWIDFIAEHFS